MTDIVYSTQFKKDFKKARKLPLLELKIIFDVISMLENGIILDEKFKDHALSGNWANYRECHIKPDLLLIYQIDGSTLKLARLGSHSELF